MGKKKYREEMSKLEPAIESNLGFCLFATSSLIGEGFDLPILDTLFLATPISFKERLLQYAGRLHRVQENKDEIRIFDYLDQNIPLTLSMFRKRKIGYREMGYQIIDSSHHF